FGFEAPALKLSYAGEAVYIVAPTEKTHAPDDIDPARVVGVVDHPQLGEVPSSPPLESWIRPVGGSNTSI
ncbi:manganese-dependent inorganic pyrophosphatase, partial [Pseudoalteromonas sp. S1609]